MKATIGQKIFNILNYSLLTLVAAAALYPFIYVLSASLSTADDIYSGKVMLWSNHFTLASYETVLKDNRIWIGYGNSFFYTIVGTIVSVLITICGAYPLSKSRLQGRAFFSFLFAFTMWFNAGMIPMYLNLESLNLINTRTGIIIAFACTTFNLILLRSFFESIPESLEEAARIDGGNDLQILTKIYLPLSGPALATIGLFYAVSRWNGYFWSMILLRDDSKIPLQVILKRLIVEVSYATEYGQMTDFEAQFSKETVIYATIVVSVIPMLLLYPVIQRFFVKGIMIGAVKG